MLKKFDVKRLKAVQQLKKLRDIQLQELKLFREKQEQALYILAEKLGVNLDKSLKHEFVRKAVHLSSLWIPVFIYFMPQHLAVAIFAFLILGDALLEYGNYKRWHWARATFGFIFYKIMRNSEKIRAHFQPTGSLYVFISALLCTMLFGKEIAAVSITVMLIADTSAALFGRAFGLRKIFADKSTEGSFAFLVSALIVMMVCQFILPITFASVLACLLATVAEIFAKWLKFDDNLLIPLVVGFTLMLL